MLNNVNIDEMLNNIYFNTLQDGMHYLNSLNMYALLMYIYRNKRNYVMLENSYEEYLFFKKCDVHTAINYRCYYIIDKRYIQLFNMLSKKSSSTEILHALNSYGAKLDYESLLIEGTCLRVERVGDRYILTSMGNTYNLVSLLLLNYIKHYRNSDIFNAAFKMSAGEYNSSVLNYITDADTVGAGTEPFYLVFGEHYFFDGEVIFGNLNQVYPMRILGDAKLEGTHVVYKVELN